MSAVLKELGETLKSLREKKQLSQRDLAARIDMTQSHLSNIENGQVNFSAKSLFQITRALEHELMFIPRQEIPTIKAILAAKEKPEHERPSPAYTPDEEN